MRTPCSGIHLSPTFLTCAALGTPAIPVLPLVPFRSKLAFPFHPPEPQLYNRGHHGTQSHPHGNVSPLSCATRFLLPSQKKTLLNCVTTWQHPPPHTAIRHMETNKRPCCAHTTPNTTLIHASISATSEREGLRDTWYSSWAPVNTLVEQNQLKGSGKSYFRRPKSAHRYPTCAGVTASVKSLPHKRRGLLFPMVSLGRTKTHPDT